MISTLRLAMDLVGKDHRSRWILLVFISGITSVFEMAGAVLVFVLLSLVADPSGQIDLPVIGDVRALASGLDDRTLLVYVVVVMGVFFLINGLVQIGSVYVQRRVAVNAGARLSTKLVEIYLQMPYQVHLRRNSSELIRNGHQAVYSLVDQVFVPFIKVFTEAFLALALLAVTLSIAPYATLGAILFLGSTAVVLMLLVQPRLKRLGSTAHAMQKATLSVLQQSLHGIRDIKVLGRERFFSRLYRTSRFRLARTQYLRATLNAVPSTVIELGVMGFILFYFGTTVAGGESIEEALSVLGMFAYVGLRVKPSIQKIIGGLNDVKYASAPLQDIHADLTLAETLQRPSRQPAPLSLQHSIVIDDVTFRYEGADRDALSHVSFEIQAGEQIGICGPTGGGKTTLVDLVTGLLNPTSGSISIDGADLKDNTRAWQLSLGVVPQMVFLIDDTLRRNIALGVLDDEVDEDALADAVEQAQLAEFVATLPQGLATTVGERGVRISGGQRQRIAVARALYRRPEVLLFDEGTSALDNATEARLMAAIDDLRSKHTIILVAHRLSTVRNSDQVVFVEDGRISGLGSYDELVEGNEGFRMLAKPL